MIIDINLKQFFNPLVVVLVTCALFAIDYFKINPDNHEIITDPVFWILTTYWSVTLFIYNRRVVDSVYG